MKKQQHFGVVGNPVGHSLSPKIHHEFAKECGIELSYEKYEVETRDNIFEDFVRDFFKKGGSGLNITLPFKQRAFHLVDQLTERARLAGAVNTIIPVSSIELLGDNTDGVGLVRDLMEIQNQEIMGKRILILGSGGAMRGILPALQAELPKEIMIASRTHFPTYADISGAFDLIINATPLSLSDQLPPIDGSILHTKSFCYDLIYHISRETVFTRWAKSHQAFSCDGLGMLIHQAAEAFYQWHRCYPLKKEDRTIFSLFS